MKLCDVMIDFKHRVVTKQGPSDIIALEERMTKEAYKLSCRCKEFIVPKVLSYDPSDCKIELEFIDNLVPVYKFLSDNSRMKKIAAKLGKSLAIIHNELSLDSEYIVRLPSSLDIVDSRESDAFLHGDFNPSNVQINMNDDSLVILDWSLTPLICTQSNYGPRYWDVTWMINGLFVFEPYKIISNYNQRKQFADVFLENYLNLTNYKLDFNDLTKYISRVYKIFLQKAKNRYNWYQFLRQVGARRCFNNYGVSLKELK